MAARVPPIQQAVVGSDGLATAMWHRFFQDMPVRFGGDSDVSITANATGYTITYREPGGTVHSKTTAW